MEINHLWEIPNRIEHNAMKWQAKPIYLYKISQVTRMSD